MRLLHYREVVARTGLSRTTIWRLVRAGDFPRPVRISPGRTGFLEDEVSDWIETKRTARVAYAPLPSTQRQRGEGGDGHAA